MPMRATLRATKDDAAHADIDYTRRADMILYAPKRSDTLPLTLKINRCRLILP